MKMNNITVIAIVGIIVVLVVMIVNNRETRFPSGRDTVKSFGDGTYQILRGGGRDTNILMSVEPPQQVLVSNVKKFKEVNQKVYIIGDGKFFILKYKEKSILQKDTLNGLPKEDKAIFQKMI